MIGLDLTDKRTTRFKKLEFRQHWFTHELRDPSKSHLDLNNIDKIMFVHLRCHIVTLLKNNFNIVLPFVSRSYKWSFFFLVFLDKSYVIFHIPNAFYMSSPSQLPHWLDHELWGLWFWSFSVSLCSGLDTKTYGWPSVTMWFWFECSGEANKR
jgi:hypothetical protein